MTCSVEAEVVKTLLVETTVSGYEVQETTVVAKEKSMPLVYLEDAALLG